MSCTWRTNRCNHRRIPRTTTLGTPLLPMTSKFRGYTLRARALSASDPPSHQSLGPRQQDLSVRLGQQPDAVLPSVASKNLQQAEVDSALLEISLPRETPAPELTPQQPLVPHSEIRRHYVRIAAILDQTLNLGLHHLQIIQLLRSFFLSFPSHIHQSRFLLRNQERSFFAKLCVQSIILLHR